MDAIGKKYVVIPWRGFRCFTLTMAAIQVWKGVKRVVVIPWRGFRCFTLLISVHETRWPGLVRL